jgi:hypothetical protein
VVTPRPRLPATAVMTAHALPLPPVPNLHGFIQSLFYDQSEKIIFVFENGSLSADSMVYFS